jgi:hypothetical protein
MLSYKKHKFVATKRRRRNRAHAINAASRRFNRVSVKFGKWCEQKQKMAHIPAVVGFHCELERRLEMQRRALPIIADLTRTVARMDETIIALEQIQKQYLATQKQEIVNKYASINVDLLIAALMEILRLDTVWFSTEDDADGDAYVEATRRFHVQVRKANIGLAKLRGFFDVLRIVASPWFGCDVTQPPEVVMNMVIHGKNVLRTVTDNVVQQLFKSDDDEAFNGFLQRFMSSLETIGEDATKFVIVAQMLLS